MANTPMPAAVADLYVSAIVAADMDGGIYCGGTDVYNADNVIEEVAELMGWEMPDYPDRAAREQWLRDKGRADEIEYLGCLGD